MFRNRLFPFLMAAVCAAGLVFPAAAAEVECSSVYCFSREDFSDTPQITGVCITGLPDSSTGTLFLGSRVLQTGDILTAAQTAQMTFQPRLTREDQTAQLEYLPVFSDRVAPAEVMTIRIHGREDKAPVAEDTALETYKNLPLTGKLKVSEPEGQTMTYTVTRQPKRGTLTVAEDGSFTYTPKKNKVGLDSFAYTAADPAGNVSREATVTVTILKPVSREQYSDTAGRECRFAAEWMKNTGIFVGESLAEKTCFQPDKPVSRGEFVAMLVKTLEIPADDYLTYTGYLDEVPTWLQPYLAAAIRSGLTAGLPNQEVFGAGEVITGAEVSVLLCNALDLTARETSPAEPAWAADALAASRESGFLLQADAPLTREQAALILYQAAAMDPGNYPDTLM